MFGKQGAPTNGGGRSLLQSLLFGADGGELPNLDDFAIMDIADVLKKETKMPFERIRIARHLDDLHLSEIRRGIVLIFAVWSGPAFVAFHRFTGFLAGVDKDALDVVVLDTDCLASEAGSALWGTNVGGGGETLWVRDGAVVARSPLYKPESEPEMIRHTQDLLDEPVA